MKVYTFYPFGNLTALVDYKPKSYEEKCTIEDTIMKKNPAIEQVGFIYDESGIFKLEMVYNELCVNAIFCALAYLKNSKNELCSEVYLVGPEYGVIGGGIEHKYSLNFPSIYSHQVKQYRENTTIELQGISHIFCNNNNADFYTFLKKEIQNFSSDSSLLVSGIHKVETDGEIEKITPYIYYHSNQRLTPETSCSSGSIALVAKKIFDEGTPRTKNWLIRQPSGEDIEIISNYHEGVLETKIFNSVETREYFDI